MKSFDFPVIFNYVVGTIPSGQQTSKKDPQNFQSQFNIERLVQQTTAPCKEFLFSKRKLIDIKPKTLIKIQPQQQSSEGSSKRNTAPRQFLLRKFQSHRTQFINRKDASFNTNKSLESQNSIKNNIVQINSNVNRSSFKGEKGTAKQIDGKRQRKRIQFKDEKENFNIDQEDVSIFPSKDSMLKTSSKNLIGSRKFIQRFKTQIQEPIKQFTNKKLKSLKKVTNFAARKKTMLNHKRQKQQSSSENSIKNERQKSKKKATFPEHQKDQSEQKIYKSNKTNKSLSRKTNRSKNASGKLNRNKEPSDHKSKQNDKEQKSRCSIKVKEFNNTFPKLFKSGQQLEDLEMRSQTLIIDQEDEELRNYLQKKYRIKTQKLIRPHHPVTNDDFDKLLFSNFIASAGLKNIQKKGPNPKFIKKKKILESINSQQ